MATSPTDDAVQVRGLRRSEYEQLIALGAFGEERVELVGGELLTMSPQGSPHAWVTAVLHRILDRQLGEAWLVRSHSGLAAWDHSMPEPDIAVVPFGGPERHPDSAVLVVEVAETSLRFDRGRKAALYAEALIPTYWVVDLAGRCVHVHTAPRDGRYASIATVETGATLAVEGLAGVRVSLDALFERL
ncbi:MAG: Uma2 family endonuclease [Deltaproteobacteria bacterium]|nr:Uma2 family endonuclease [Deltaproteobacteria bacterium]